MEVDGDEGAQEREADGFAANFLIPPDAYQRFLAQKNPTYLSHADVCRFADSLGVASSIVVGRLHHDKHVQPHKFVKDHIRPVDESVLQR